MSRGARVKDPVTAAGVWLLLQGKEGGLESTGFPWVVHGGLLGTHRWHGWPVRGRSEAKRSGTWVEQTGGRRALWHGPCMEHTRPRVDTSGARVWGLGHEGQRSGPCRWGRRPTVAALAALAVLAAVLTAAVTVLTTAMAALTAWPP